MLIVVAVGDVDYVTSWELSFSVLYLAGGNTFAVKRITVEDCDEVWLNKQLRTFPNAIHGFLYARLKPNRWFRGRG